MAKTATNARAFNLALTQFAQEKVPEAAGRVSRWYGLEALRRWVLRCPVDTGRARGSIQAGLGAPDDSEGPLDPNGSATIARGASVIAQAKPFQTIHVSSNLEYMPPLEDGHSQQAPAGMVALTVEELRGVNANKVEELTRT